MNIELRKVKYAAFASQETPCFSADVYIDGVKAGSVDNSGQGGCNSYYPFSCEQALIEHAKTLPDVVSERLVDDDGKPFTYRPDADSVVGDLLDAFLSLKDLRTRLKRRILWKDADGKRIFETGVLDPARHAAILAAPESFAKNCQPGAILNLMSEADALAAFRALV